MNTVYQSPDTTSGEKADQTLTRQVGAEEVLPPLTRAKSSSLPQGKYAAIEGRHKDSIGPLPSVQRNWSPRDNFPQSSIKWIKVPDSEWRKALWLEWDRTHPQNIFPCWPEFGGDYCLDSPISPSGTGCLSTGVWKSHLLAYLELGRRLSVNINVDHMGGAEVSRMSALQVTR
jgi:hypothetical protein